MTDTDPFDISTRMDWVASYPKSGNTWVRMLLFALYRQTVTRVESGMDVGAYLFGAVSSSPVENLTLGQQMQLRPAALYHLAHRTRLGPTLVKSHQLNGAFFGIPMFSKQWVRKVIYIVRDPRDVLPSFAEHTDQSLEQMAEQMGDPEACQRHENRGTTYLGSWSQHVASWLDDDRFDTMIVHFEDLKDETGLVLRRMADHLDYERPEITDHKIENAVEATDFDKLAEAEQKAQELGAGFPERAREDQTFFRRGESQGWREEVPPELVAKIERDHGKVMQRLGYEREAVAAV